MSSDVLLLLPALLSHWTVVDDGKNICKLHNNHNFLAIINGTTQVVNYAQNPMAAGQETKFRLIQKDQFILLESMKEKGCFIAILPSGELKSAVATGKDNDGCFGVRLVYKYQPPPPPTVTKVYVPPGSTVTQVTYSQQQPQYKK